MLDRLLRRLFRRQGRGFQLRPYPDVPSDLEPLVGRINLVRYQFRIEDAATISPEEYLRRVREEALPRLLRDLADLRARDVRVAVCVMTPPGGDEVFFDWRYRRALIYTWQALAASIKENGLSDVIYGYDLLNEPRTSALTWSALARRLRRFIRAIDPDVTLIVSSPFGDPYRLDNLDLLEDQNVIYTFHHYYPMGFTHQGVYEQFPMGRRGPTRERLQHHLRLVRDWQRQHSVRVFVGEFSVVRWAAEPDASNWLRWSIEEFERYGWDWTYHAWREWDGWSLEHGSPERKDAVFSFLG